VNTLFGQARPDWIDEEIRAMQYPSEKYLVGFASGNLVGTENIAQATERIKNAAQGNLLESVKVNMSSSTRSQIIAENSNGQYYENESFVNQTAKNSAAEIVGMKTESYFDKKDKQVYVLAYASRSEVIEYHKKLLDFNLSQIDGLLSAARKLSDAKDNTTARSKCSEALSLFDKVDESQNMLIAVGSHGTTDMQHERTKILLKSCLELQARLDPKFEILENLKNELSQKLMQTESLVKTCKDLVANGEKPKAKQQCESAKTLLNDIRRIQQSMRETDPSVTITMTEQNRTEKLDNEVKLLSAQLTQAVMVYVVDEEDLFGKKVNVIAGKLKSQMAVNGCSFTDDEERADFKLTIKSEIREGSESNGLVFCFADVSIDFFDSHKQKSVYSDDLSEKGGSTTKEKAARKAMENVANQIMKSIAPWLN